MDPPSHMETRTYLGHRSNQFGSRDLQQRRLRARNKPRFPAPGLIWAGGRLRSLDFHFSVGIKVGFPLNPHKVKNFLQRGQQQARSHICIYVPEPSNYLLKRREFTHLNLGLPYPIFELEFFWVEVGESVFFPKSL